ncbi:type II toxin-antitoxin system PemK/MazF family toxin [Methanothermococcus sp. SCGC AD-155-M21]|nr:type II toxin-antitoxin system PemK/MazF family toxin [Methanothermococcus sp. SCGC AD-155-M21]
MAKQGEIWTAPFPYYDDREKLQVKRRPVIIVSKNEINDKNFDIIICQISRHEQNRILKLPQELKNKVLIITSSNLLPGVGKGLRNISIIKPFKLFTIPKDILLSGEPIGKLNQQTLQNLLNKIHDLF